MSLFLFTVILRLVLVEYIRNLPSSVFNSVLPWLVTEVSEGGRGFMEYSSPEITFSSVLLVIRRVAINTAVRSKAVFVAAFWIFLANSQYFNSACFLGYIKASKIT